MQSVEMRDEREQCFDGIHFEIRHERGFGRIARGNEEGIDDQGAL